MLNIILNINVKYNIIQYPEQMILLIQIFIDRNTENILNSVTEY